MADLILPGNATPAQILTGYTASAGANYDAAGTMPNQGSPTFTPSGVAQSIPAGYYGGGTINPVISAVAAGTVTSSGSTSVFNLAGGGTQSFNTLTLPVPSGAIRIVAIKVNYHGDIGWWDLEGYADGLTANAAGYLDATAFEGETFLIATGGALQISTSSIFVPCTTGAVSHSYAITYLTT